LRSKPDKCFEESAVVELLGMPLDAEHRPTVVGLQRLGRPVVRSPDDPQPGRHSVDGLVVMAGGRDAGA
jgi:hypothetical protein